MTSVKSSQNDRAVGYLSILVVIFSAITSTGGLLIDDLYHDTDLIKTAWFGNDLITLLVVGPSLIISTWLYLRKGSTRGMMIWLGLMLYVFYNYAFYLFGAAFNSFFLLYVGLFCLSLYALLISLYHADMGKINIVHPGKSFRIVVSVFLLFIALSLGSVEISQCVSFLVSGKTPEVPTLIFALDLSLVVPNCILAAILLLRKNAWGIVLSVMMLVKSFTYGLVLMTATALIVLRGTGPIDRLMPFYLFVAVGGLLFGALLLRNTKFEGNNIQTS